MKEARHKRTHTVKFHLHKTQVRQNQFMGLDNRKVVAFVGKVEFSGKGYERTF